MYLSARRFSRRLTAIFIILCLSLGFPPGNAGCAGLADRLANADTSSVRTGSTGTIRTDSGSVSSYEIFRAGKTSQAAFDELCRSIFLNEVTSDTLTLHYNLASPIDYGITDYDITLGDYSEESFQKGTETCGSWLAELHNIPRESLTARRQLTWDVLDGSLSLSGELADYRLYQEPLIPTTGLQAQLPILLAEYHFRCEKDIEDYLGLCTDLPRYFSQILTFEQEKAQAGLFMCNEVLDQILRQCDDFLQNPEENYMISAFEEALVSADWLTEAEKTDYCARNRESILSCVIPAYRRLSEGLEALRGSGANDRGLCYLENGEDYYRLLVRRATGSSRTVEELIDLVSRQLLSDVRMISQLYETVPDTHRQLSQTFSLTEPSQILIDLKSKMRNDFPMPEETSCQFKYVPECLEEHISPAFYLVPPLDALTENCIYLNRSSTDSRSLYTTLAHEAYPGHLYQTVYSASCEEEPLRSLLSFKGYTEGWATYVEWTAYGYEDSFSPELAELLTCNARATLALYALCDMNIHLNGWDIAQTGAFLRTWINGLDDAAVSQIYYAIVANPANYLSYHIGALEFIWLREEAEAHLGDAFDLKGFHTVILETGSCSFDILRRQLTEWMAAAAGA